MTLNLTFDPVNLKWSLIEWHQNSFRTPMYIQKIVSRTQMTGDLLFTILTLKKLDKLKFILFNIYVEYKLEKFTLFHFKDIWWSKVRSNLECQERLKGCIPFHSNHTPSSFFSKLERKMQLESQSTYYIVQLWYNAMQRFWMSVCSLRLSRGGILHSCI